MLSNTSKGIRLAFLTALVSGISIFINKFAVGSIAPPLLFTATKNSYVGLIILGILLVSGKWRKFKDASRKDLGRLALIGVVGGSIPFYLFFTGISMIPAINAAIIHKTLVLWVAILAVPFLGERINRVQGIAILLLFGGNLFVGGFTGFKFALGELFVLGATLLWAVETIIAKKTLKNVDPDLLTFSRMGLGAFVLVGMSLVLVPDALTKAFSLDSTQWFWLIATAVALLAYVSTWYRALSKASAITVATVLVSSTLITNVLAALFITGKWNLPMLLPQAGLMLAGLGLLAVYESRKSLVTLKS